MRNVLFAALLTLSALGTRASGQESPQRGNFKRVDAERKFVIITTEDGKDIECAVVPQSMFRNSNNEMIADFKANAPAAGSNVMFKIERRGDQTVLIGLKIIGSNGNQSNSNRSTPQVPSPGPPRKSIGVKPLTELGDEKYKGESGGLYGNNRNEPPVQQQSSAKAAAARIQPLDETGKPSSKGRIGLLGIGMSNTTQEFSMFKKLADADPDKSDKVAIVDVAQGGQAATQWTDPSSEVGMKVWSTVDQRLKSSNVSSEQVQVVWIKQALIAQAQFGAFPAHAKKLENDLTTTLQLLKRRFPNLQIAYLSSRIYAGYATTSLNPEPYAYEGAFSIRWIIDSQINGDPKLNCDAKRGEVKSPVVLWGPYLWADGISPRLDGLVWDRSDLSERDGTHPSESGRQKVAEMLKQFFHSDPYAKTWYLK